MISFYKKFRLILGLVMFGLIAMSGSLEAQDIHYSQAHNSALNINPALTGIFNQDIRISANYRHQWYTVPVPYLTFTGAYDQKFYKPGNDFGFFSGGILFNYDQAGDSRLTMLQLALSGSYTFMLNKNNLLTVGLQAGGSNRHFNMDQLMWDNQFDGFFYNPERAPNEEFDFMNLYYLSTGTGVNYRWQKNPRTKIDIGIASYNFSRPHNDFYDGTDYQIPVRWSGVVQSSFKMTELFDLMIHGLGQIQGPALEVVPAAIVRLHLNQRPGSKFSLDLGAIGRWSRGWDAVAPTVGLMVNDFKAELSYDINLSDFTVATSRYGGPEISIQYFITHVKPLDDFKSCPIF